MLFETFVIALGINLFIFVPAYLLKTDKLTDISYATTFVVVALYGFMTGGVTIPSLILFVMIFFWAIRLGGYLLTRIRKVGKDARFDGMRENFWRFAGFWLLQGLTVWAVLLPSVMFFEKNIKVFSPFAFLGVVIWLIGILIETFADLQKYRFINNPKNKGRWIESGLWKYSRHPNYFGEILLWIGVYVYTVSGLDLVQSIIGVLSPLYLTLLLIFVSGIPLLERSAEQRWGEDKKYREYKKRTSSLIPLPPKKLF